MSVRNDYKDHVQEIKDKKQSKMRKIKILLMSMIILVTSLFTVFCFFSDSSLLPRLNLLGGRVNLTLAHDEGLVNDIYNFSLQNASSCTIYNDLQLTITSENDISNEPLTLILTNKTTNETHTLTVSKVNAKELIYKFEEPITKDMSLVDYELKVEGKSLAANRINYHFDIDLTGQTSKFGFRQDFNMKFDRIGQEEIFTYNVTNNKVTITGLDPAYEAKLVSGSETGFTIPTLYHELPVTTIQEGAFDSLAVNYSVTFEEGVETIEDNVFNEDTMTNTEVILPASLKKLGSGNFEKMNLEKVQINSDIETTSPFKASSINNVEVLNTNRVSNNLFDSAFAINNITLADTVSTIGANAFSNITSMFEDITLPDNVTVIENEAFSNILVKTFALNNTTSIGASAFKDSTVVELNIPEGVSTIGTNAFNNSKITNLTMSHNPGMSFAGDTSPFASAVIDSLQIDKINTLQANMFNGAKRINNMNITESLVSVGKKAFANIEYVGSFDYDETITSWEAAFYNTNLNQLNISDSLKVLPGSVFADTKSISEINFGGLTDISYRAFANTDLSNCPEISLPEGLTKLNQFAFANCESIKNLVLPSTLKTVDTFDGHNPVFENTIIYGLQTADGLTTLPKYIFANCIFAGNATLKESNITTFSNYAFNGCDLSDCANFDLPHGLTTLNWNSFSNITLNRDAVITIPKTLTKVDTGSNIYPPFDNTTFYHLRIENGMTKLPAKLFNGAIIADPDFTLKGTTITTIDARVFIGCDLSACVNFDLPQGLTTLNQEPFANVTFSKDAVITIPKTLKTVNTQSGYYFPFDKTTIYHLKIEDGMTTLPANLFKYTIIADKDFTLKNTTITTIGANAFYEGDLSACVNFDLPHGLTTINDGAFKDISFSRETTITIPKSLKKAYAGYWDDSPSFAGATFYHLKIEDGITALPASLFRKTIIADSDFTLSNTSITTINNYVFAGCNLESCINFEFPSNLTTMTNYAFSETKFNKDTVITIPKTLTNSGSKDCPAFNGTTLYKVQFEDGLATLPSYSFKNAIIEDPNFTLKDTSISLIKGSAFYQADLTVCTNFALPNNIQTIESNAFDNVKINDIYIYNTTVTIDSDAFANTTATIHGYIGSTAETYATDNNLTFEPITE